ncbi:MAG: hypothetical protein ISQ23_06775 [Alphaproteobacteria bacterium]|nr:hypothetical protein [Alphaproteobacteria bacterium]MBL6777196.1 hypothetical protein [Alphaproteobacteria bacterium]
MDTLVRWVHRYDRLPSPLASKSFWYQKALILITPYLTTIEGHSAHFGAIIWHELGALLCRYLIAQLVCLCCA